MSAQEQGHVEPGSLKYKSGFQMDLIGFMGRLEWFLLP